MPHLMTHPHDPHDPHDPCDPCEPCDPCDPFDPHDPCAQYDPFDLLTHGMTHMACARRACAQPDASAVQRAFPRGSERMQNVCGHVVTCDVWARVQCRASTCVDTTSSESACAGAGKCKELEGQVSELQDSLIEAQAQARDAVSAPLPPDRTKQV